MKNHSTQYKANYIATIIKAMWYWWRDTHVDQWNKKENQEIDLPKYTQKNFDKDIKWRKDILYNKWCWSNWTTIVNGTQPKFHTLYRNLLKIDHRQMKKHTTFSKNIEEHLQNVELLRSS